LTDTLGHLGGQLAVDLLTHFFVVIRVASKDRMDGPANYLRILPTSKLMFWIISPSASRTAFLFMPRDLV
jgi:hypothetical protein